MDMAQARLIVYGHDFCSLSLMLEEALTAEHIDYEWRDILCGSQEFQEQLRQLAGGCLSVPTVVFPDGTVMVEPMPGDILQKLGPRSSQGNLLVRFLKSVGLVRG